MNLYREDVCRLLTAQYDAVWSPAPKAKSKKVWKRSYLADLYWYMTDGAELAEVADADRYQVMRIAVKKLLNDTRKELS